MSTETIIWKQPTYIHENFQTQFPIFYARSPIRTFSRIRIEKNITLRSYKKENIMRRDLSSSSQYVIFMKLLVIRRDVNKCEKKDNVIRTGVGYYLQNAT